MSNKKTDNIVTSTETPRHVEIDSHAPEIELGQWYWLKRSKSNYDDAKTEIEHSLAPEGYSHLACVTEIGSNYVEFKQPREDNTQSVKRLLVKELPTTCLRCEDHKTAISNLIKVFQHGSNQTMATIKELTSRLGLARTPALGTSTTGTALQVVGSTTNVDLYKDELIKAKDETLPALFEEVKRFNRKVAKWVSADTLELEAQMGSLKEAVSQIDSRIFNVSLYAGLGEETAKIKDGAPAAANVKLHVMQRKLYMDEECLVNYRAGGMSFSNIEAFDEWLVDPENLTRCLPFERCIVAFQVRRHNKNYNDDGKALSGYINMLRAQADKATYLYVRNGEQVYRVDTELEFDDMLFPSGDVTFNEPQMVKMFTGRVDCLMPKREYDFLLAEDEIAKAKYKQWEKENPAEEWHKIKGNENRTYGWANPYRNEYRRHSLHEYQLVDENHLYFDSVMKYIDERIEKYNRIVLIIQGLLDRSEVVQPHPPTRLHVPSEFDAMLKLVYDAEHVLTFGEAPSFEEYKARCNLAINHESVFVGQEQAWFDHECAKENEKRERSYYRDHLGSTNYWRPSYGEHGMGFLARPERIQPKARKAVFSWLKERANAWNYNDWDQNRYLRCTFTVPYDDLLNVSAYKKGDYKQFFQDPRTRQQYIKWAPFLLAAEDYACGVAKAKEPNTFSIDGAD